MNRLYLFLTILVLLISNFSCKKDDETIVENDPKGLHVNVDTLNFLQGNSSKTFHILNDSSIDCIYTIFPQDGYILLEAENGLVDVNIQPGQIHLVHAKVLYQNISVGEHNSYVTISSRNVIRKIFVTVKKTTHIPPEAIFNVTPEIGQIGTTFIFDASNSQDDETPAAWLSVRWQMDAGDSFTSWSFSKIKEFSYSTPGIKEVTLEVKDGRDLTSTHTSTIEVTD